MNQWQTQQCLLSHTVVSVWSMNCLYFLQNLDAILRRHSFQGIFLGTSCNPRIIVNTSALTTSSWRWKGEDMLEKRSVQYQETIRLTKQKNSTPKQQHMLHYSKKCFIKERHIKGENMEKTRYTCFHMNSYMTGNEEIDWHHQPLPCREKRVRVSVGQKMKVVFVSSPVVDLCLRS